MAISINKGNPLIILTEQDKKALAKARERLAIVERDKGGSTLLDLANAKADVIKNLPALTPDGFKVAIFAISRNQEIPFGKQDVAFKATNEQADAFKEEIKLRKASALNESAVLAKMCSSFYGTNGVQMLDLPQVRIDDKGLSVTAKGRLPNFTKNNRVGVKGLAALANS
tara:strand:- start:1051 stop:1560 length:510 start_codon:yes stop_codon:yes gene_type:complete